MADLGALYISARSHQGREAGSMVERRGGGPRHTSSLHNFEVARCLSQCRQRCAFDGPLCLHGFHGFQSIACSSSKSICSVSEICGS